MRQRQALSVMLSGQSVFLTGAPGAGKTYVLNEFVRRATRQHKIVAVTASTGIAATHIGGTTIHSWSGLGIRDSLSEWDRERLLATERLVKRYNATDVLVIDEVSMLHGSRLDLVNETCKLLRKNDKPFGGLQVILVGDLFQLPPVSRYGERIDFAHTSTAWAELNPQVCYLTEQHRQYESDSLLDLLNAMRRGDVNESHEELLRERLSKHPDETEPVTRLYAHNIDVESINKKHLDALTNESKLYSMQTKGVAAKIEQLGKSLLAPPELVLKKGAEVMFVANNFQAGFVNGTRGRVMGFKDGLPMVELQSGKVIKVEPHTWALTEDDKKRAEISQLPLRLAWAITIHKSQGMSLDAAEIDLSKSFAPGMGYVGLSRVRSLDGVYLRGINNTALQMHPDIYAFDRELRQASEALANITEDIAEEEVAAEEPEVDEIVNEELFDALKKWRLERARTDKIAPFIVAHNTLLAAIAKRPPTSVQQLMGMPGFGAKKLETYGEDILKVTAEYLRNQTP